MKVVAKMTQIRRTSPRSGRARERILRRLLAPPPTARWTAYSLAKASACTNSYADAFLKKLEKQGFVKGARVVDHAKLFRYWLEIAERPRRIEFFASDPLLLFRSPLTRRYGLTTYAAEAARYGYLALARYDLYIEERGEPYWRGLLESQGAARGAGNVRLLIADADIPGSARPEAGTLRLFEVGTPLSVVDDSQLVLDLYREGGPAVEGADRIAAKRGWTKRTRTPRLE